MPGLAVGEAERDGITVAHWSKYAGCRRTEPSQIDCRLSGSSQIANPVDSSVTPIPAPELVPDVQLVAGHASLGLGKRELQRLGRVVSHPRASHTNWNSCAQPIAITRDLPT